MTDAKLFESFLGNLLDTGLVYHRAVPSPVQSLIEYAVRYLRTVKRNLYVPLFLHLLDIFSNALKPENIFLAVFNLSNKLRGIACCDVLCLANSFTTFQSDVNLL